MLRLTADWVVYSLLRFGPDSKLGAAVHFFIYDSIKILLLLLVMISVIGFLRTYLPQKTIKAWLSGRKGFAHFFASAFGAVTPFCSCSSIPIFFGILGAGVPLGVGFSFLITSPLINEYLVVLMLGFFGWKITVAYVLSGMAIGMITGLILGRLKLERLLVSDFIPSNSQANGESEFKNFRARVFFGLKEAHQMIQKLWAWVLLGVAIGALIHNYVPEETIQSIVGKAGVFSVPIATLVGVPMYGSCAAIVPVAVVLFQKGVPLGTALAFMMAVSALSLPEAIMLRRAMRLELIAIFFTVTTIAIVTTGYVFNFLQPILNR
ncbi:MAG: permease [Candidatus Omnitrophica bacterium]|nr:permease [Candidatus Omnitrophota bacterium]